MAGEPSTYSDADLEAALRELLERDPIMSEAEIRAALIAAYGTDAALDGFLKLAALVVEEE